GETVGIDGADARGGAGDEGCALRGGLGHGSLLQARASRVAHAGRSCAARGSLRRRFLAAWIALYSASAVTAVPGSPIPPGASPSVKTRSILSIRSSWPQRPRASSPRRVRQVDDARATRLCFSSVTSHSTSPTVFPRLTTRPVARSLAVQTGLRKLIFSSSVVKVSPSSSVLA